MRWIDRVTLLALSLFSGLMYSPAGFAAEKTEPALSLRQDNGDLVISIGVDKAESLDTSLLFFDTDNNAQTGYCPPSDPALGVDMLIQGGQLFKFSGQKRDAWDWSPVEAISRKTQDKRADIRLNASLLGGQKIGVSLWIMSADWQSSLARVPAKGLEVISLEASRLKSVQARKSVDFSSPRANRDLPVRTRVARAGSFYCYYGKERVEELSYYDVVILHSPEFAPDKIRKLKELGVVTIGYITVGEDDKLRTGNGKGPGGYASWYFQRDQAGKPDRNGTWNSYYANASDPEWRADRVAEAKRLINEDGFDGIFLDTLDTVERYRESYEGMVQLVQELRNALPGAPIILNQGYSLLPRLVPISDGLMLESFTSTYDFSSKQYMLNYPGSLDFHLMRMKREVLPILAKHPFPVFVLDYALPNQRENIQTAANRAVTFGFLFAAAPIFLDDVYMDMPVGKPDPKWLEKSATPESMALTLKQSVNGFPAGAKIIPSGCFAGYTVEPLVDGIADRAPLHWSKAAWASAEDGDAPWLQVLLPAARTGGTFIVDFYKTPGERYLSRDFIIEAQAADGKWIPASVTLRDMQALAVLPSGPVTSIRIRQTAAGGSAERPNLLWLSQIALRD